jgi:hypothetical protein
MAASLHMSRLEADRRSGVDCIEDWRTGTMRKTYAMTVVAALFALPPMALAADKCPTELSEAKAMLGKATAASKSTTAARQDPQAPRQLAGAKAQDVQAPRSTTQDVQAPRSTTQDVQAPRSTTQDVQAPRSSTQNVQAPRSTTQDVQAPRSTTQDVQAPRTQAAQAPRSQDEQASRVAKARKLIADSEAACKKGDMAASASKAKEAMGLLK